MLLIAVTISTLYIYHINQTFPVLPVCLVSASYVPPTSKFMTYTNPPSAYAKIISL